MPLAQCKRSLKVLDMPTQRRTFIGVGLSIVPNTILLYPFLTAIE